MFTFCFDIQLIFKQRICYFVSEHRTAFCLNPPLVRRSFIFIEKHGPNEKCELSVLQYVNQVDTQKNYFDLLFPRLRFHKWTSLQIISAAMLITRQKQHFVMQTLAALSLVYFDPNSLLSISNLFSSEKKQINKRQQWVFFNYHWKDSCLCLPYELM